VTNPSRRNLPTALIPAVAPVVAVVTGLLACAVAARSTGAMDPFVFVEDAGPLVRWSVPLVRVGHDVAAAVTVASLVFAASLVPARALSGPRMRSLAPSAPLRLAAGAGLVWAVLALVGVVLTFADAAGLPLSSPALGAQLQTLVWQVDATRIGLLTGGCAVVVATGAVLARSRVAAGWLGALGALGVMVLGLASHTGASDDHETSVDAMALHLLGATTWVGGLVVLVVLHGWLGDRPGGQLGVTARRYSTLALVAFVTVGLSGVLAATTRLASWSDLGTPYGRLIVVKSLAFVALGLAGWWHRRRSLPALDAGVGQRAFVRLALGEVAVMGATFGVAAALSRSAPPVPEDLPDPTPALAVTGFPAPPDPSTVAWWATWRTDWLWLAVAVVLIGVYAACAVAARVASARALVESHRDDSQAGRREAQTVVPWPVGRSVSWVLGCLLLVWVTSGPLGVYGRVSFAWHTALLLVLALVVPLLLVAASPVTLAERALPHRDDGTLGPREVVVGVARSGAVRAFTRPVTATVVLVGALVLLHATGLLDLALTTHPGHLLMSVAALGVGGLWVAGMVGPGGNGPSGSRTVLWCLGALDLCAFAAAAWLARTSTVLGAAVLGGLDLPWLRDLEADQRRAAGVILLVVVPVSVLLAVVVLVRSQRAGGRGR
jgi:putative copper resistance protein D